MKTMILAAAAILSLGVGAAYASDSEDGGTIPNTYFSELPGEVSTAPGQPPNSVAAEEFNAPVTTNAAAATSNTTVMTQHSNGG